MIILLIHILGAVVLSTGGAFGNVKTAQIGDLLIIMAMGFFSLSYFPASNVSKKIGAMQSNSIMLLFSGLFFLPFALFFSKVGILII